MDWLQLFLLTVNPQYGYNIDTTNLCVVVEARTHGRPSWFMLRP